MSLEAVASLDARLRYVAKRAVRRVRQALNNPSGGAAGAVDTSSGIAEDISFMGAGVSSAPARGRRGSGRGTRKTKEDGADEGAAKDSGTEVQIGDNESASTKEEGSSSRNPASVGNEIPGAEMNSAREPLFETKQENLLQEEPTDENTSLAH